MPLEISNTDIIDLANWSKFVAFANNLEDRMNAFTGVNSTSPDDSDNWGAAATSTHTFNPSTQKILYGRFRAQAVNLESNANKHVYYGTINFSDSDAGSASAFSQKPIVTASIEYGYTTITNTTEQDNANTHITFYAINKDGFGFRLTNPRSTTDKPVPLNPAFNFYINWTATGLK